ESELPSPGSTESRPGAFNMCRWTSMPGGGHFTPVLARGVSVGGRAAAGAEPVVLPGVHDARAAHVVDVAARVLHGRVLPDHVPGPVTHLHPYAVTGTAGDEVGLDSVIGGSATDRAPGVVADIARDVLVQESPDPLQSEGAVWRVSRKIEGGEFRSRSN